jgi:hypothetical protein
MVNNFWERGGMMTLMGAANSFLEFGGGLSVFQKIFQQNVLLVISNFV